MANSAPQRLLWEHVQFPGKDYHLARVHMTKRSRDHLHHHDYVELLWVEQGEGQHYLNGQTFTIRRGNMVMMRPDDVHDFTGDPKAPLVFINVAFPVAVLHDLAKRHFKRVKNLWGGLFRMPQQWQLDEYQLRDMDRLMSFLQREPHNRAQLEAFLTQVLILLYQERPHAAPNANLPEWLMRALHTINDPEHFVNGSQGLVALCHKSTEHVSRTVKQLLSTTPSAIVNQARLRHAANELSTTNRDILDIALTCGYQSLAQFYSGFKKHYQLTPRQYRLKHLQVVENK